MLFVFGIFIIDLRVPAISQWRTTRFPPDTPFQFLRLEKRRSLLSGYGDRQHRDPLLELVAVEGLLSHLAMDRRPGVERVLVSL